MEEKNVFQYASTCEANFEANLGNMGNYKRKTTFYSDLSIAEYFSTKEVIDTYRRVMNEWLVNIEYITEFVICLNHKCWEWYYKGRNDMSKFYASLYEKAANEVLEHYQNDREALDYYYATTD